MSDRRAAKRVAARTALVPLLLLALVFAPLGTHAAAPQGADPDHGPVFDRFDPSGRVRAAIDPAIAQRLRRGIERGTPRGGSLPETALRALAACAAEMTALAEQGRLTDRNRREVIGFAVLAVLEEVLALHPEAEPRLAEMATRPSPAEEVCSCDKRGSRACGCTVYLTGPGECQYYVSCPSYGKAFCSAINAELCVARTVMEIL